MAINFQGYLFKDDGNPLADATVQLLETGTTSVEASTTTSVAGLWSISEPDQDRYDVKISFGTTSVRYRRWDDQVSLKEIDVRNNTGATTPAATFTNLTNSTTNQVAVFSGANSTKADNDEVYLSFKLADSAGNLDEFARMTVVATDVTSGSEDGQFEFDVLQGGSLIKAFTIASSTAGAQSIDFNQDSITFGTGTAATDITLTFDAESADGVLTWMEDEDYFKFSDDLLMNSTERINFYDTGLYIYSSADGQLDIVADTEVQIAATTIDINGAVALNGAITGATDITLSGELDAATLDISGNADIDGTLETDALTVGGTNVLTGSLITTLGTISAGVWQGTAIASGYIAADAITGAKIADDAIDSEHYTDGSIDNAHIADDAIDSEHYADGSIDNAHIADDAIDSEHYADGSIDNAHIADDAIDSEHYADASIDFAHIQNVAANSILGRNANSSGVLSEVALATTQLLIGDGTGFTAAALSGDATMTNAGVVSLAAAQTNVTSLLATDIKIGEDAQTVIDFETANEIHFDADNAERVKIDSTGLNVVSGSLETATIDYTDGDLAITIADGGGITAAAGITSTAAANSFGATSFSGDASLTDNTKVTLGTGGDADIYYDATDMVINTRVAGSGDLVTHSQLVWGTGVAVTAADYSIGRDADGTNQLHFNVPSGAGYEFSVADGAKFIVKANGALQVYGGGAAGDLDFAWTFDTNTGFYRSDPDRVNMVAGGVSVAGWGAMGLNTAGIFTARSTTNPTRAISLFNGTAPVGTLADGVTLYSASGELLVMDAAGNATTLS